MNQKEIEEIDAFIGDLIDSTEKKFLDNPKKELTYSNLLGEYLRKIGKTTSDDYSKDIPYDFELSSTELKIKILRDAINRNILITESEYYDEIYNNLSQKSI